MLGIMFYRYRARSFILAILVATAILYGFANGSARINQSAATRPRVVKPTPTPTPQPAPRSAAAAPQASVADLLAQGKAHYRAGRLKAALVRFESALKAEPEHDEALGLAAITAFRLDSQEQAREWFLRRANLEGQKDSVRAFSYYRIALTYWRQVHDEVAKSGIPSNEGIEYKLAVDSLGPVREMIQSGLDYAGKAIEINANYAEAYNVRNLLQTEWAFAESDQERAAKLRTEALESLRTAIKLQRTGIIASEADSANFNLPTVRISEISRTQDEDSIFADEMLKLIEGGRPVSRVSPVFPSMRSPGTKSTGNDPSATGVTDKGGAYSIGGGRGALTAAYAPGTVKVEVLISGKGEVVFAHVVDGRDDLNGAAILAARGWKFSPPRFEGTPVQVSGMITFDMKPPGGRSTPSTRSNKP
ncbi:MAG: energy transducer TonB [Acidobacteria bacterium]|nr:energy transducer TonB [Acidobacteriota bacterium]MCW5970161.1 energy transducer TonB [Blastocatellales bacterium]